MDRRWRSEADRLNASTGTRGTFRARGAGLDRTRVNTPTFHPSNGQP
jgi:hypothetical protein